MAAQRDENAVLASWRTALKNEKVAARDWPSNWGFLTEMDKHTPPQGDYARVPVKYIGKTGPTVEMKRVAILPHQQEAAEQAKMMMSGNLTSPGSTMTAMESTFISHTQSMERLRTADPQFKRTSEIYGSRQPLEQFGIAQHGITSTAVTNFHKRDLGQF